MRSGLEEEEEEGKVIEREREGEDGRARRWRKERRGRREARK